MSYLAIPEFPLEASPKKGTIWDIQRTSDAFLTMYVRLPDIDAGLTSADTIAAVYGHIRENRADTTPKIILGNTGGRTGATLTRPEPNLVYIVFHLTDVQTADDLDLQPRQAPTNTRQEVPGRGYFDVLLEAVTGSYKHYVYECEVLARTMVTRIDEEA